MALRIEVTAYSGHRGEEAPRSFVLGGRRVEVAEITGAWLEEEAGTRARKRFFRLRAHDGRSYTIYHDEERGGWFCQAGGD